MKRDIKRSEMLGLAIGIAVAFILYAVIEIPCPIKYLTGISCAGCGMTRALRAFVSGDISAAFLYHPVWPIVPIGAVILPVFAATRKRRAFDVTLYTFIGILAVTYIIRIIFFRDATVSFDPSQGLIVRWLKELTYLLK